MKAWSIFIQKEQIGALMKTIRSLLVIIGIMAFGALGSVYAESVSDVNTTTNASKCGTVSKCRNYDNHTNLCHMIAQKFGNAYYKCKLKGGILDPITCEMDQKSTCTK